MSARRRHRPWFSSPPSAPARLLVTIEHDSMARSIWLSPSRLHFSRSGEQISMLEWTLLFEDVGYRVIDQTHVEQSLVSTIWLGLDHGFDTRGEDQPLQFETMVLPDCDFQARYRIEAEARAGHARAVDAVRAARGITAELMR